MTPKNITKIYNINYYIFNNTIFYIVYVIEKDN